MSQQDVQSDPYMWTADMELLSPIDISLKLIHRGDVHERILKLEQSTLFSTQLPVSSRSISGTVCCTLTSSGLYLCPLQQGNASMRCVLQMPSPATQMHDALMRREVAIIQEPRYMHSTLATNQEKASWTSARQSAVSRRWRTHVQRASLLCDNALDELKFERPLDARSGQFL